MNKFVILLDTTNFYKVKNFVDIISFVCLFFSICSRPTAVKTIPLGNGPLAYRLLSYLLQRQSEKHIRIKVERYSRLYLSFPRLRMLSLTLSFRLLISLSCSFKQTNFTVFIYLFGLFILFPFSLDLECEQRNPCFLGRMLLQAVPVSGQGGKRGADYFSVGGTAGGDCMFKAK